MIDSTPGESSAQPGLETVSSETDVCAVFGSAASPEDTEMASKDVPCKRRSYIAFLVSLTSSPAASFTKPTLETLPPEILIDIFEHLGPFDALGLALASLVFSAVFKRAYPR